MVFRTVLDTQKALSKCYKALPACWPQLAHSPSLPSTNTGPLFSSYSSLGSLRPQSLCIGCPHSSLLWKTLPGVNHPRSSGQSFRLRALSTSMLELLLQLQFSIICVIISKVHKSGHYVCSLLTIGSLLPTLCVAHSRCTTNIFWMTEYVRQLSSLRLLHRTFS